MGLLKLGDLIYLDSALFMHDYYSYGLPSTSIISLKALVKYNNLQPEWPLRSLIIYWKLGRIMEKLISLSAELNYTML